MSKDPAFLYYDGDASRDMSHMNRLERGAYIDLIHFQKKFGGFSLEKIKKLLGTDFEACWDSLQVILASDENGYYIEWLRDSIERRKHFAEKQRQRIQNYWDNKKKDNSDPPLQSNQGNTTVLPLENENGDIIEDENRINSENSKTVNRASTKPFEVDYDAIVASYHSSCKRMTPVQVITKDRKRMIDEIVATHGIDSIPSVFKQASQSNYLNGEGKNQWRADFDWLMNPGNFLKVMEGKYKNRGFIRPIITVDLNTIR